MLQENCEKTCEKCGAEIKDGKCSGCGLVPAECVCTPMQEPIHKVRKTKVKK